MSPKEDSVCIHGIAKCLHKIGLRLVVVSLSKRNRARDSGYPQPSISNTSVSLPSSRLTIDDVLIQPRYLNTPPEYKMNAAGLYPLTSNG